MKGAGDDLLERPAGRGAARVALLLCREADQAAWRLRLREDDEALHDLRVALRRLRSTLRAWKGALPRKAARRLAREVKGLAGETGRARDAEVQRGWLAAARDQLSPEGRLAADRLSARYEVRHGAELARLRQGALARWDRLSAKLARRLGARADGDGDGGEPFGAALAALLRDAERDLAARLARVASAADEQRAHQARIVGKRLRYLLEPLRKIARAGVGPAVKALQEAQDLLGDLHDRQVLAAELAALGEELPALERDPAARRDIAAGLRELARRARDEQEQLFRAVAAWRGEGMRRLAAEVERVARAASASVAGEDEPKVNPRRNSAWQT